MPILVRPPVAAVVRTRIGISAWRGFVYQAIALLFAFPRLQWFIRALRNAAGTKKKDSKRNRRGVYHFGGEIQ
jgi:hypothetical protein